MQPSYYGVLPAAVRYDKRLSASEKIMYTEVTALSKKEGNCYASNQYFADLYGVQPTTASAWINNLKKYGYVDIEYEGRKRKIFLRELPKLREKPKEPSDKAEANPSGKPEDINTSIIVRENNLSARADRSVLHHIKDIFLSKKANLNFQMNGKALNGLEKKAHEFGQPDPKKFITQILTVFWYAVDKKIKPYDKAAFEPRFLDGKYWTRTVELWEAKKKGASKAIAGVKF